MLEAKKYFHSSHFRVSTVKMSNLGNFRTKNVHIFGYKMWKRFGKEFERWAGNQVKGLKASIKDKDTTIPRHTITAPSLNCFSYLDSMKCRNFLWNNCRLEIETGALNGNIIMSSWKRRLMNVNLLAFSFNRGSPSSISFSFFIYISLSLGFLLLLHRKLTW